LREEQRYKIQLADTKSIFTHRDANEVEAITSKKGILGILRNEENGNVSKIYEQSQNVLNESGSRLLICNRGFVSHSTPRY